MTSYKEYLKGHKDIIAMIHLAALPGTPQNDMNSEEIIDKAICEAQIYERQGIKTVMIENMNDVPYTKSIGPEITSVMAIVGHEIKKMNLYCGIQVLAGGNREALAVAKAADLDFIRVEGYVYAHIGDEGIHESCAGELMRYRKQIGAENVLVFADIDKKHSSHSITADLSLSDKAKAARFFGADAVIITGKTTGEPPALSKLCELQNLGIPVIIGSGMTIDNYLDYYDHADAFIIGSYFKEVGDWRNKIDQYRLAQFIGKGKK